MEVKVEIKKVLVKDLKYAPYNPRKISDEMLNKLKQSIEEFGYVEPIVVNKRTRHVVGGNQRLKALEDLGIEEVEAVFVDLDDAREKALNIALNKITGEWDYPKLKDLLEELDTGAFDIELTGFDLPEIEDLMTQFHVPEEIIEDEVPEPPEEPITKPGDLWILGRHRLLCGDATKKEDVERLMDGKKADMVFTDPPYGMKKENKGVLNDNLNYDDLLEFNKKWIPLSFDNLKGNGSWYCWGMDEPLMDIYSNILKPMRKDNKITFRNLITWNKGHGQGQLSEDFRMYPIADEKCLFVMCGEQDMKYKRNLQEFNEMFEPIRQYFEKERKASGLSVKKISEIDSTRCSHYWARVQFEFPTREAYIKIQDYCQKNGINAFSREYDELKQEYDELKQEFYKGRSFFDNTHDNMNNVWTFSRTSGDERETAGGHATPKPIALCARAIKSSSREGEIVLDVFGGSGSTLIACEQLNRTCYMMEIAPVYCDVIVKRWENFTGRKANKA